MGRGPEMKRCITRLCQSCDRDFLSSGLGCLGETMVGVPGKPGNWKRASTLKAQCMQITSCPKPLEATVPENNVT